MVPGGNYNYGRMQAGIPGTAIARTPNYWWNGGRSFYGSGWGGHYWGGGWRRGGGWGGAGWGGGAWSSHHRNWNIAMPIGARTAPTVSGTASRRTSGSRPHQASAGHHQPGHHAAASVEPRFGRASRHGSSGQRRATAGHRAGGHRAGGHAAHSTRARGRRAPELTRAPRRRPSRGPSRSMSTRTSLLNGVSCNRHDYGQRESSNECDADRADRHARGLVREILHGEDARSKPLEQWLAQLKDPDAAQRRAAVVALGAFGPDLTKAMISQVGELLKDPDQSVRHAAALSIGNFGPAAKAALANVPAPSRMRRRS